MMQKQDRTKKPSAFKKVALRLLEAGKKMGLSKEERRFSWCLERYHEIERKILDLSKKTDDEKTIRFLKEEEMQIGLMIDDYADTRQANIMRAAEERIGEAFAFLRAMDSLEGLVGTENFGLFIPIFRECIQ